MSKRPKNRRESAAILGTHEAPAESGATAQALWRVETGDCLDALASLTSDSIEVVITDAPYGIDFNGEDWDGRAIDEAAAADLNGVAVERSRGFQFWVSQWARECWRVLCPGGFLACFGAPRMFHRLACGLEDAGFEVRDLLIWMFGTGMPKSRVLEGGLRSDLKPGFEPIALARKPLQGSLRENLNRYGTGALNIAACRSAESDLRYPANVVLSHLPECGEECAEGCPVAELDACAQQTRHGGASATPASRFFYCPKPSSAEREAGCEGMPVRKLKLFSNASGEAGRQTPNFHPTVKPVELMRWLTCLLAPAGGTVLDPFCGSGSTGIAAVLEGRSFIGVEREADYAEIAQARIAQAIEDPSAFAPASTSPSPDEEGIKPGRSLPMHGQSSASPGQSPAMPRQSPASPGQKAAMHGQSSASPGQSPAMPRQSSASHGQKAAMHGQSSASPGQSSAMPRQSPASPGQTPAMPQRLPGLHGQSEPMPGQTLAGPLRQPVILAPESVEAIVAALAQRLDGGPVEPKRHLSATEVAALLGVERSYVYEHAEELGAIRLGDGPRPRLRFDPEIVNRRLAERGQETPLGAYDTDSGRSPASPADSAELLPIRGTQS